MSSVLKSTIAGIEVETHTVASGHLGNTSGVILITEGGRILLKKHVLEALVLMLCTHEKLEHLNA